MFESFYDSLCQHTPKFIEVQGALRTSGEVQRNQLITISEHIYQFSNTIRKSWGHCANEFYIKSLEARDDESLPNSTLEKIGGFVKKYRSIDKKHRFSFAEGEIRSFGGQVLLDVLLLETDDLGCEDSNIVDSVASFLDWNTALRKCSHVDRHYNEVDGGLSDEDFELILDFLNQQDFDILLPKVAKGSLICQAIADGKVSNSDGETLSDVFLMISNRIDKVCEDSETSSLKVYEQRLRNLVWGPSNYQRDEVFIREAADALTHNKITAFYGLGGVGKTALAQKLMFDIINNREPYTHIVTHSSKVGSDQKEINTIGLEERGMLVETDEKVSVMDTALINDRGVRVIGGLRNLLLKIYKEATGERGDNFGDAVLQKKVFAELKKPENKILIILDNFEDVEDNQDDPDVQEIRNETKSFLKEFSKINEIQSRIIITTRSSPMDVAYGIEVKHLTKAESVTLFAEKIRFRSRRTRRDDSLSQTLIGIYQKIRSSDELKNQLIESFDLWDTHDDYIAHPLIVLLAAEEVAQDDIDHLKEVIKEYGEGTKHRDVIEYCVSKTLGSFDEHEKFLLQLLVQNSNLNSEITTKLIHHIIKASISNQGEKTISSNTISSNLNKIKDSELIDIMTRLSDRTFVRVIPKRISSGGVYWSWNKIVYDYLCDRFEKKPLEEIAQDNLVIMENLKPFPEYLAPLRKWIKGREIKSLTLTSDVLPLERSVDMMVKELGKCVESGQQTYELESLVHNLDLQSALLIKLFQRIEQHMIVDPSLKSIESSGGKGIAAILNHLLRIQGRQARSWRYVSKLSNEFYPSQICIQYSIEILSRLKALANKFYNKGILTPSDLLNLLKNFGLEHVEILDTNVQLNGTLYEKSAISRLDWLEQICTIYNPEKTSLRDGLELTKDQFEMFQLWAEVFEGTNLEERTRQLGFVEGYAFWVYLRLFATDKHYTEEVDIQILDELKEHATLVRSAPNINQYIRSVQSNQTRVLWDPNEFLDSIINFRSQPTNGTFMYASMKYDEPLSRWEQNLERRQWKLVVKETNQGHESNSYDKVVVIQENFLRTEKKIVCRFHRDAEDEVVVELGDDLTLMAELERVWKKSIDELIKERRAEFRNEISLRELKSIIEHEGGPSDEESIIEIVKRITSLYKVDKYFVIDPLKPYSPPPPQYMEIEGGKSTFTTNWNHKHKILLPSDPTIFGAYMITLFNLVETNPGTTFRRYNRKIQTDFGDNSTTGAYFVFHGLGNRHKEGWLDERIDLKSYSKVELVKCVEKSVLGKCELIRVQSGHTLNRAVIKSYFVDVLDTVKSS